VTTNPLNRVMSLGAVKKTQKVNSGKFTPFRQKHGGAFKGPIWL